LGSGKQWVPWVAMEEVPAIVQKMIEEERWSGPVNTVAPHPVRNEDLTRMMAHLLKRPAMFPVPAFALKLLLGEMGEVLLLGSQRTVPEKLMKAGYEFRFPNVEEALKRALVRG